MKRWKSKLSPRTCSADLSELEKADAVAKLCQTRPKKEVAKLLGLSAEYFGKLCAASRLPQSLRAAVTARKISAQSATIAHRVGGTGFAETVSKTGINQNKVNEIAGEIGRIKDKNIRERVKESASRGSILSAHDVVKKTLQYSKPKDEEPPARDVGVYLINARMQLETTAETLEGLGAFAYAVRMSGSWPPLEKSFSRLEKAVQKISTATKPKE
jgi:hypothetical protein